MQIDSIEIFGEGVPVSLSQMQARDLILTLARQFGNEVLAEDVVRLEEIAALPESDRSQRVKEAVEIIGRRLKMRDTEDAVATSTSKEVKRIEF